MKSAAGLLDPAFNARIAAEVKNIKSVTWRGRSDSSYGSIQYG
jgi:hypothetical protein